MRLSCGIGLLLCAGLALLLVGCVGGLLLRHGIGGHCASGWRCGARLRGGARLRLAASWRAALSLGLPVLHLSFALQGNACLALLRKGLACLRVEVHLTCWVLGCCLALRRGGRLRLAGWHLRSGLGLHGLRGLRGLNRLLCLAGNGCLGRVSPIVRIRGFRHGFPFRQPDKAVSESDTTVPLCCDEKRLRKRNFQHGLPNVEEDHSRADEGWPFA